MNQRRYEQYDLYNLGDQQQNEFDENFQNQNHNQYILPQHLFYIQGVNCDFEFPYLPQQQPQLINHLNNQFQQKPQREVKKKKIINEDADFDDKKESQEYFISIFDSTLTGFIFKLFEQHQNVPLMETYIVEQSRANIKKLKRNDGSKYKGSLKKTVKGTLTSNGLFEKDSKNNIIYWSIRSDKADEFKQESIHRIENHCKRYPKRTREIEDQSMTYKKFDRHQYYLLKGFLDSQKNNLELQQLINCDVESNQFPIGFNKELIMSGYNDCMNYFNKQ